MRYHQEAIIQLVREKWNPFYGPLPKDNPVNAIWVNHYPKGFWYCAASLYALTGKIEFGKFFNYVSILTAFFSVVRLLITMKSIRTGIAVLIGVMAALNPITPGQLMTYYVDCQMASYITVLVSMLVHYYLKRDAPSLAAICGAIVITANIKLTGIVYAGVLVAGLWTAICLTDRSLHLRAAFAFLASAVIAVALVGFNPYITNIRDHGNPFYPAIGGGKIDIITNQWPLQKDGTNEDNRVVKLVKSLYYSPETMKPEPYGHLMFRKTPYWGVWDARIAGFGPLFNVILTITLIGLVPVLVLAWRRNRALFGWFAHFVLFLMVSIFITPACWWARMAPQLWLLPIAVVLLSIHLFPRRAVFPYALLLLMLVNVIVCVKQAVHVQTESTRLMREQLEQLKAAEQPVQLYPGELYHRSLIIRLEEHGISAVEVRSLSDLNLPKRLALVRPESDVIVAYREAER